MMAPGLRPSRLVRGEPIASRVVTNALQLRTTAGLTCSLPTFPVQLSVAEEPMKRSLLIAGVVLGTVARGAWRWRDLAQAQARADATDKGKDKHEVHTSGSATIRVMPDSARVFFRLETYETKIEAARAENNRLTR